MRISERIGKLVDCRHRIASRAFGLTAAGGSVVRNVAVASLGLLALSACAGPSEQAFDAPISASSKSVSDWSLRDVRVTVPSSLTVSTDPNVRFPNNHIVWWEDPAGDRRAQVGKIVHDAVERGAQKMRGSRAVVLDVTVGLFHAVTPRARAVGTSSWHDITLAVAVRDARTGAVLASAKLEPDLDALHGDAAKAAEARGETQKVRISRQIAAVTQAWLVSSGAEFKTRIAPVTKAKPKRSIARVKAAPMTVPKVTESAPVLMASGGATASVTAQAVAVPVTVTLELPDAQAAACGARGAKPC
ncbi:DUF6778 family protein [Algicella marina]|uniref:Uncharacterized protein n=1 Tax=Algicella marina TaxID=2683284 RepID=A0A6P1T248_9RHOB|nr:DUF6778 family protein [Algicella marina]QHQ35870.1 hypothetical protein GO499_12140 [Algicella marina]